MSQTVKSLQLVGASFLIGLAACGGSEPDQPVPEPETTAAVTESPATVPMDMEFADDLGVDLEQMTRLPSGLYYQDLTEGGGLGARDGHVLNVYYTGLLTTGQVFDSNNDGEGYSFQLGRRDVILGWEQGIQGMRIGGKRLLVIPPSLGYGQRGRPPVIPPSATLVFEVELLNIRL